MNIPTWRHLNPSSSLSQEKLKRISSYIYTIKFSFALSYIDAHDSDFFHMSIVYKDFYILSQHSNRI